MTRVSGGVLLNDRAASGLNSTISYNLSISIGRAGAEAGAGSWELSTNRASADGGFTQHWPGPITITVLQAIYTSRDTGFPPKERWCHRLNLLLRRPRGPGAYGGA